ncbi:MAG: 30S ribosomal protein S21 [Phycisphaerales bacterium]|nr:30S ribosomal protein S21 [Phycisphaerales bacterium]
MGTNFEGRTTNVIKVKPRGNESVQQLLRRFKRLCQREGLTRDIKRTSYYEKPSERKRRQSRKSARRVPGTT